MGVAMMLPRTIVRFKMPADAEGRLAKAFSTPVDQMRFSFAVVQTTCH